MFGGCQDPTLLRQFFKETDVNNNGYIEVSELGTIVKKMYDNKRIKYDDAKIQEDVEVILNSFDTSRKDGKIDEEEFLAVMCSHSP